jgi:hypothetical protein
MILDLIIPNLINNARVASRRFHEAVLREIIVPLAVGPQLFANTGEAVSSRSRSSPVLAGWWSAQQNDSIKGDRRR